MSGSRPCSFTSEGENAFSASDPSPLHITYSICSPTATGSFRCSFRIATITCGWLFLSPYSCGCLVRDLVMARPLSGTLPGVRRVSATSISVVLIEMITSSLEISLDSRVSTTVFDTSLLSWHQSLLTISIPFSSYESTGPLGPSSYTTAAYFFFFSSNILLNMPSISITRSRWSLFTSDLSSLPSFFASLISCERESTKMESVSPYTTSKFIFFSARSIVCWRISLPFIVIISARG
mmetsp:Transcript_10217/g.26764  ORF Transcript_10217/g.26764 Transcript_10217/m.26764 type:complete len:237 (-) Transcript_10217:2353-3063(-)